MIGLKGLGTAYIFLFFDVPINFIVVFSASYFLTHLDKSCDNCHFYGTTFPKQDASTWAPNMALTKDRLNPDWVKEWLRDPQNIMPGTKMPAPFLPTEDLLTIDGAKNDWGEELVKMNGDTEAMLDGLRDYVWSIKGKTNIDKTIQDYFDENGYEFSGDEDEDEDEWGDDDDW